LVNAKHTVRLLKKIESKKATLTATLTEDTIVHGLSIIAEHMGGQQYGSPSSYTKAMHEPAERWAACIKEMQYPDRLNHFLADPTFVEAVRTVMQH
jgi:hypothetical protein